MTVGVGEYGVVPADVKLILVDYELRKVQQEQVALTKRRNKLLDQRVVLIKQVENAGDD